MDDTLSDKLPGVMTIEQNQIGVAKLLLNGVHVVSVDAKALERQGFDPFIFTRLLAFAPIILQLLVSAQNLIALIGLEWSEESKARSYVLAIEDPNLIKVEAE